MPTLDGWRVVNSAGEFVPVRLRVRRTPPLTPDPPCDPIAKPGHRLQWPRCVRPPPRFGRRRARPYFDVTSPQDWLTTDAFGRLRCVSRRRAQQVLAEWHASNTGPRVRVVTGGRGRPRLQVLAADVAALYGLGEVDVMQLAA